MRAHSGKFVVDLALDVAKSERATRSEATTP